MTCEQHVGSGPLCRADAGKTTGPRPAILYAVAFSALLVAATLSRAQNRPVEHWVGTWASSQQRVYPGIAPPGPGLAGVTLRQVVRVSVGGQRLRVRLANDFGVADLHLLAVHVATSTGKAAIRPGTDTPLKFDGKSDATIVAGAAVWSDPTDFDLPTGSDLAITLSTEAIDAGNITEHPGARCTSYTLAGATTAAADMPGATTSEHWYWLSGVDVATPEATPTAIVCLGDSITDGRGSVTDGNTRWPDFLARRLAADPATRHIGVLNAGIGGNNVLHDGLGPAALARFDRDVLAQTAASRVIVLEGVNDIGGSKAEEAPIIADRLISAYRQMISRAHARDMKICGGTITPFAGSQYGSAAHETARQTVNAFVRGGAFDAFVDFDAAVRDAARSDALAAAFDSGDHLHLNSDGYRKMAETVDLRLLMDGATKP